MKRQDIHKNFIRFMERYRSENDLTICEMADRLGMAPGTYKNIVYGKSDCIDIEIACRLHDMTHKWMWEMVGYESSESDVIDMYHRLNMKNKWIIKQIAAILERSQN